MLLRGDSVMALKVAGMVAVGAVGSADGRQR